MIVKWNLFIMILCSSFDEIILYSFFEFGNSSNYDDPALKAFGIIIALACIAVMGLMMYNVVAIVVGYQRVKKSLSSMMETE